MTTRNWVFGPALVLSLGSAVAQSAELPWCVDADPAEVRTAEAVLETLGVTSDFALRIETVPPGATVAIDDRIMNTLSGLVGRTPMIVYGLDRARSYKIVIEAPDHLSVERHEQFSDTDVLLVGLEPRAQPTSTAASDCVPLEDALPGFVTIGARPYARVYLGDRLLGETPLARMRLPAGCVQLRLVAIEGGKSKRFEIEVQSNRLQIYRVAL